MNNEFEYKGYKLGERYTFIIPNLYEYPSGKKIESIEGIIDGFQIFGKDTSDEIWIHWQVDDSVESLEQKILGENNTWTTYRYIKNNWRLIKNIDKYKKN